jgi:cation diffusion facilitator CzcD-associated flavoprotein CzcO
VSVNSTNGSDSPVQFDPDAVHAKYLEERDKRLIPGRAAIRDLTGESLFTAYREDPFTPFEHREPLFEEIDVAVVGAGIGGVVAGANLRKVGIERIRVLDQAGGVGGTWYWNRYPGVMCDVESYIYMPMLEDLDYVPTRRYAFGDEIREHLEAIAHKYDLVDDALFHTGVQRTEWDEESARWILQTDRGDEIRARYVVMAVGILNLMKLPDIPGMELFKGKSFHTGRWDYEYTGGDMHSRMDKLADKVVGIIGTGASAIQCVGPLGQSAKQLYVFQRTPSAVGVRDNRPTSEEVARDFRSRPGWQRERMYNFHSVLNGEDVVNMVADGWTRHEARVWNPRMEPGMTMPEFILKAEEEDFEIMEEHRRRIDETVADSRTAEILKPYYRYLCKRPCFHDEYLPAFNLPSVTLVDCPTGIQTVTERGLICNGQEYELDCLIYATGFEAEVTPFPRRAGHDIIGRGGLRLADKWAAGPATLHGMMTRGFPNFFMVPAPGQQGVISVNFTLVNCEGAEHIAAAIKLLDERGVRVADVSEEAERDYVDGIVAKFKDASVVMEACTPSRLNNEGNPKAMNPRAGSWGGGRGNLFGWIKMLKEWREAGDFAGLETDQPVAAS